MSQKDDYAIEDVCLSLDNIETQLKRMIRIWKMLAVKMGVKLQELETV